LLLDQEASIDEVFQVDRFGCAELSRKESGIVGNMPACLACGK
jgi:hypothetical protein